MIADIKRQAREALHGAMAAPVSYIAPDDTVYPTADQITAGLELTARWHNKMKIVGERTSDDAGILEGINRLVFNSDQLDALGLTLERLGVVTFSDYAKSFRLDYDEEPDGPLNVYWTVVEL